MRLALPLFTLILAVTPLLSLAQSFETTGVAKTVVVSDPEVSYGDVILYDVETNQYRISQVENDPRFFGIVVEDPTLVLQLEDSSVPIVERGLVPVNVTLENGAIDIGDPITTSSVLGKATLALEDQQNIFGFAAEALTEEDAVAPTEEDILMGTILVEVGGERLRAYLTNQAKEVENSAGTATETEEESEDDLINRPGAVMRFGFASLVALGAIFLIFFAFLSSIRHGVVSVGRNPRAGPTIRSMVILNVVLALVITAAAIFFAISLLVIEG